MESLVNLKSKVVICTPNALEQSLLQQRTILHLDNSYCAGYQPTALGATHHSLGTLSS